MDYRHNEDGSWTYYCEGCTKQECVGEREKPRKILSFSEWVGKLMPEDAPFWLRARMGDWVHSWHGGIGYCRKCAKRKFEFLEHTKSPEEREDEPCIR